jgi:hypothetical protein
MVLFVGFGILFTAEKAQAAFQLRFEEAGCAALTITDNGPGDSDPTVGRILFVGSYCDFDVNTTFGISKPLAPNSSSEAFMDFNTQNLATAKGGTLLLTLADTDFDFPGSSLTLSSSVGGTIGTGSVHIVNGANPNNVSPLATDPTTIPAGSTLIDLGTFGPPAYSNTVSGVSFDRAGQPAYSLFLQANITLGANQKVAFDNTLQVNGTPVSPPLSRGDAATIGFWHNKNGQALINCVNGGSTSTNLGNWLASNFPNLFGSGNPGNNLTGKTNAQVAGSFSTAFGNVGGVQGNTYAQVFATALAAYVTSSTLAGPAGVACASNDGFNISSIGTGGKSFNVGSNGAAAGVPNGTILTILQLLQIANVNFNGTTDLFYGGDPNLTNELNNIFNGINQGGDVI